MEHIKKKIKTYPHWPKEGVMFRDVFSLLRDPEGFKMTMDAFEERYKAMDFDIIVGIDSRGFIMGAVLADRLGKGFVPVRKKGKLPGETESVEYELEYGTDEVEMHKDSIMKGHKVLIVDDLLATGGTCSAAAKLVEKLGGEVVECAFVIDLPDIGGSKKLKDQGRKIYSLVEFEGD